MDTIEKMEMEQEEVMDVTEFETVDEIEAENSGKGLWIIGGAVVILSAGYALVKKVIVPGVKKLKAKHEEKKKAKENGYQYVDVTNFEDSES